MNIPEGGESNLEPISPAQRERMVASVEAKIRHYQRCKALLGRIDEDVFHSGVMAFDSEDAVVEWLCEPALSQGGEIPLDVMGTVEGRKKVAKSLRAIAHGIPI